MDSIIDFFSGLFQTRVWPPRWHCGYWSDFHGWLYITSDLMIWLAYFMIPVIIFNYVSRRKQVIKYSGIYLLFAAFMTTWKSRYRKSRRLLNAEKFHW